MGGAVVNRAPPRRCVEGRYVHELDRRDPDQRECIHCGAKPPTDLREADLGRGWPRPPRAIPPAAARPPTTTDEERRYPT